MSSDKRLEEIIGYASNLNLDEQQKRIVEREFFFGMDDYKGECLPGLAGAIHYLERKEDNGALYAARAVRRFVAINKVRS